MKFPAQSIVCQLHWWKPGDRPPPFDQPLFVVWLGKPKMATFNSEVGSWQEYPDGDFDCGGEVTWWSLPTFPPKGAVG